MQEGPLKDIRCIHCPGGYLLNCPARSGEYLHVPDDGRWTFNGDYVNPTFSPSIKETGGREGQSTEEFKATGPAWCNHYFVKEGNAEYCTDSTHEGAGKILRIVPFTPEQLSRFANVLALLPLPEYTGSTVA